MEELEKQIRFVSTQGHFVSPDLHLEIRRYFQAKHYENILAEAKQISSLILDPLLQQQEKPSSGSIELLDILGTLTFILDHKIFIPYSEWLFKLLMRESWSVYATTALYNTTLNLLLCDNIEINLSKAVSFTLRYKEIRL